MSRVQIDRDPRDIPWVILGGMFLACCGMLTWVASLQFENKSLKEQLAAQHARPIVSESADQMPDSGVSELVPESALSEPEVFGADRSGQWPTVRNAYFRKHPHCEFAGCKSRGPFNVHHIQPFHLKPELELDPDNLITLCVGEVNHHLYVGHNGSFQDVNPNVREDCWNGVFPKRGYERMKEHLRTKKTALTP